jgi:hypothetical protein
MAVTRRLPAGPVSKPPPAVAEHVPT